MLTSDTGSASGYIKLADATKLLPRPVHVATLWRWCHKGCGGVRLRHVRVGREHYTTPEWVREFLHRGNPQPPATPDASAAAERALAAEHRLDGLGI